MKPKRYNTFSFFTLLIVLLLTYVLQSSNFRKLIWEPSTQRQPVFGPAIPPGFESENDLPDRGGQYLSVPLTHFNNTQWKKQFAQHTFFVASCLTSNKDTQRHTVKIMFDADESAFPLQEHVFNQFHLLWIAHGKPKTPMYKMNPRDTADNDVDFLCLFKQPTKAKKKKRNTNQNRRIATQRTELT